MFTSPRMACNGSLPRCIQQRPVQKLGMLRLTFSNSHFQLTLSSSFSFFLPFFVGYANYSVRYDFNIFHKSIKSFMVEHPSLLTSFSFIPPQNLSDRLFAITALSQLLSDLFYQGPPQGLIVHVWNHLHHVV